MAHPQHGALNPPFFFTINRKSKIPSAAHTHTPWCSYPIQFCHFRILNQDLCVCTQVRIVWNSREKKNLNICGGMFDYSASFLVYILAKVFLCNFHCTDSNQEVSTGCAWLQIPQTAHHATSTKLVVIAQKVNDPERVLYRLQLNWILPFSYLSQQWTTLHLPFERWDENRKKKKKNNN